MLHNIYNIILNVVNLYVSYIVNKYLFNLKNVAVIIGSCYKKLPV